MNRISSIHYTLELTNNTHMDHPQQSYIKRLKIGALIVAVGTVPLLIYVMVGPKDGNPIGLGLLMWLSWLTGGVLLAWGGIGGLMAYLGRGH